MKKSARNGLAMPWEVLPGGRTDMAVTTYDRFPLYHRHARTRVTVIYGKGVIACHTCWQDAMPAALVWHQLGLDRHRFRLGPDAVVLRRRCGRCSARSPDGHGFPGIRTKRGHGRHHQVLTKEESDHAHER
jgi:hypothetical protein